MAVSSQAPDSQFAYVVLVARRARQLMSGARPLIENPKGRKFTRIAEEELLNGVLEFEIPDLGEPGEDEEGKRRRG